MPEKMSCFWCVVEMVNNQEFGTGREVVTMYHGTPMCSTHTARLGRKLGEVDSAASVLKEVVNA